jgi:outer membrane protein OmpA-like peptidoglycan-associated protein
MNALPFLLVLAAAAPPPERLDALAFDNGAVLLSAGGSYGEGVSGWSAWNLTDGSEAKGWCSPQGSPVGLEFVWDLDTSWELDTFAVSTRNMQEDQYPGISARMVELHVGGGGSFRKLGTFQVGKGERKEYPLPKGTAGRQVKVVVTGNHGNLEFTEIAELEVFGRRAAPVATPKIAGDYQTNYGPMRFLQEGEEVYGCYDWTEGAVVAGTLVGRNARVVWTEYPGDQPRQGTATFAVSPDGKKLWGVWFERGEIQGEWAGTRAEAGQGPTCTPRRRSRLEALRKEGRLVLYGLRFDSGSDAPRPESDATLASLAATLVEDPKLRLRIEGHTDSTNTDAYNLDLSQRRAQKVLEALVKRGIAAARLEPKGFGRAKPVADNATAQGRALNRRVEVSVLP